MSVRSRGCNWCLPGVLMILLASPALFSCARTTETSPEKAAFHFVTKLGLLAASAPDANNVWAVGYSGTIFHSADSGATWVQQASPLEIDLFSVCFIDTAHGWIGGKSGTVLHTEDGGTTWRKVAVPTEERLFSICFVDVDTGWLAGPNGTIIHTSDRGKTWTKQGPENDRIYNSIFFINKSSGWVVGEFGTILQTADGGVTWEQQECKDIVPVVSAKEWETPTPSLYDICFLTPEKGWAVGLDGIIIATDDGGKNWSRLESGVNSNLYSVAAKDDSAWVVGDRGGYIFSANKGKKWKPQDASIKTKFWLRDIAFADAKHGWAVGSAGTIARTADGGITWDILSGIKVQ
ncbi:MAG: YCF48-related protein [Pseudomonadota bacterium]